METKFDEDSRKIFNGIQFVLPDVKPSIVKAKILSLSAQDRQLLKASMIRKDSYNVSKRIKEIYEDSRFQFPLMIRYINELAEKNVVTLNTELPFSVCVEETEWGTATTVSTKESIHEFMWGCPTVNDEPDVIEAAAQLVRVAFVAKGEEAKVVPSTTYPRDLKDYHPDSLDLFGEVYSEFICQDGPEGVDSNIHDLLTKSTVSSQVLKDVVGISPLKVIDFTTETQSPWGNIVKGARIVRNTLTRDEDFATNVTHLTKMASSLGSPKQGLGSMRNNHYDGIGTLTPAQRRKYEWITDFNYQDAQVYIVDTKDELLVGALYRVIDRQHRGNFIIVYDRPLGDIDALEYVMDRPNITIFQKGTFGIKRSLWDTMFDEYDTYYISFKQPHREGGSNARQLRMQLSVRQLRHKEVVGYGKYMYYDFVSAMGPQDLILPSCRGRDTRVIFTNCGVLGRAEAVHSIKAYVAHALLYPYLNHCYLHRKGSLYVYPGVRPLKYLYDFTPLENDGTRSMKVT